MNRQEYTLSAEETYVVKRARELFEGDPAYGPAPLREAERNGLRAFLQRAETRLSTYQRVAGVFLNGAGLLVLLPGLARESIYTPLAFATLSEEPAARWILLPWLLTTAVPLYAFFLLLRDLVQFYFSPRFLESDPIRINRFALAGVTLPYDEGLEAKAQVIAMKARDPSYVNFILGGTSKETLERAHTESKAGKTAFPLRLSLMEELGRAQRSVALTTPEQIGVALSLAGSLDLSLVGEVARMEASVCRHVLLLRKLVLRYSKALILFVWTTLLSLAVAGLLEDPQNRLTFRDKTAFALFVYSLWAAASVYLVRLPLRWIDQLVPPPGEDEVQRIFRDPDLEEFERRVTWVLGIGAATFLLLAIVVVSS